MAQKENNRTQHSSLSAEELIEKLSAIEGISSKKMFGGHGVFHEERMFCFVDSKGNRFMKTNATNKGDYEALGAEQHSRMPYFTIPEAVEQDMDMLIAWAKKSIAISK